MRTAIVLTGFVVATLAIPATVHAQTWFYGGPSNASILSVAVDPVNSGTVYAGTTLGAFKSTNGGASWREVWYGSQVNAVAIDPFAPTTVYLGTNRGLLKTSDAGQTWTELFNLGISIVLFDPWQNGTAYAAGFREVLIKTTDGGVTWTNIISGLDRTVTSLAIDPWRPWILYAGTSFSGLYKTDNGGGSWYPVIPPNIVGQVNTVAVDLWDPNTVYFADSNPHTSAIYVSSTGGWTWELASGPPPSSVTSLLIDPQNPFILYAGSVVDGIHVSDDRGRTWIAANAGLSSRQISALVRDPGNPSTLYAGTADQGMFKSSDRGATWSRISDGLFGMPITSITFDRFSPSLYAAGPGGVYRSHDYGLSWQSLVLGIAESAGTSDMSVNSVAIDPAAPSTLYAGTNFRDVLKTTDGGQTWTSTRSPSPYYEPIRSVVVDPGDAQTLYAGGIVDLVKSVDGGINWSPTGYPGTTGNGSIAVGALAISPVDSRILYATRSVFTACYPSCSRTTTSVMATMDAGASWFPLDPSRVATGESGTTDIAIDPSNPAAVYVALGGETLWRSHDGGATWNSMTTGLDGIRHVAAVAVDPHVPGTLYAAGNGVFKSVDGGQTWVSISDGLFGQAVATIEVHPTIPGLVYAGTSIGVFILYQPVSPSP